MLINPSEQDLEHVIPRWIDGKHPLPTEVLFWPLETKRFLTLLLWSLLALFFLAWAVLPLVALGRAIVSEGAGLVAYLAFGAVMMVILFSVLLYGILSFLIPEYRWWVAARNGRLRHGIFLGREKMVVRGRRSSFLIPREMVQAAAMVERKRGQRFEELIELRVVQGEPVQFSPEVILPPSEVAQRIRQWIL